MKRLTKILVAAILALMLMFLCACGGQTEKTQNQVCTLIVRCDTILNNMDKLNPEKKNIIPKDGIVFSSENVAFSEGDNLLDILKQELQREKIHLDFDASTSAGTAYVKGINNIYAADCGDLSGWLYMVNDESINVGCTDHFPKNGDVIEWVYTCDMGNDL